ncbi:MAG: methyltransferase domain-containing protein, partial [Syntrophaceae bacterium]
GNYKINMVDIAENALEDAAKGKLGDDLSLTIAPLWQLPQDFPHADWGYCIDVLMTVPPEKLDDILAEIRRTCESLFCQVYDWPDERLRIDYTTIKETPEWWEAKLKRYWPSVQRLESPEHKRRYIFVCAAEKVSELGTIAALRNAYKGQVAWIVGRGPSLLNAAKEIFGTGPVIVLNEAIINIARLDLPNDVYTLWRNGDVLPDLPKYGAAMILCDNPVAPDPPSSTQFNDYRLRYTFECQRDLGCVPSDTFSMKAALEIAFLFGCDHVNFIAFDTCTIGDVRTILDKGFVQSEHVPGAYNEQCNVVRKRLDQLKLKVEWITPIKKAGPLKLNLGCGELLKEGYVNIDLHYPGADEKMDDRALGYSVNSVDEIYSSHLLEHFGKYEVPAALKEWFRVLKVGASLNMLLPSLEWCLKNWLDNPKDREGFALSTIFGLQTSEGEYHKTGFTKDSLKRLLKDAGFSGIKITETWSHDQSCFLVTAVKKDEVKKKIS